MLLFLHLHVHCRTLFLFPVTVNWHVGVKLVVLDEKTMQDHLFRLRQHHAYTSHRLYLYHHLWFHTGTLIRITITTRIRITIQIILGFTQNVLKLRFSIYACIDINYYNISLENEQYGIPLLLT